MCIKEFVLNNYNQLLRDKDEAYIYTKYQDALDPNGNHWNKDLYSVIYIKGSDSLLFKHSNDLFEILNDETVDVSCVCFNKMLTVYNLFEQFKAKSKGE